MTFGSNQGSNAVINIRLVRLPLRQWPKVGRGAAKQQLKKYLLLDNINLPIDITLVSTPKEVSTPLLLNNSPSERLQKVPLK